MLQVSATPTAPRSSNAADHQRVPRALTVMAKEFAPGQCTPRHTHPRAQLIYAVSGTTRVSTDEGYWTLPPQRALWVPPEMPHTVEAMDAVSMRTLYVRPDAAARLWTQCHVVEVTGLLRELILTLAAEPVQYALHGRTGQVARLLLSELADARIIPIRIPWPRDRRLQTVCRAILREPGRTRTVQDWGDTVGASGRTLIRLFQAELGMNYRQWVQQVRLAEALSRLSMGQPVARIAAELGYRSPSAFTVMFRRALGAPPQSYLASASSRYF